MRSIQLLLIVVVSLVISSSYANRHFEVAWDFVNDEEGWGKASEAEMQTEIHVRGGMLKGVFTGIHPHFDSPPFEISANDKHHVVLRMAYSGNAKSARFYVRHWNPEYITERDYRDTSWSDEANFTSVDFEIANDGKFRIYYVPFYLKLSEPMNITQLRFFPALDPDDTNTDDVLNLAHDAGKPQLGDVFMVDWIRISRAPTIKKVEGCTRTEPNRLRIRGTGEIGESFSSHIICNNGDSREIGFFQWCGNGAGNKYFDDSDFLATNDLSGSVDKTKEYAAAFNCLRSGGERITITGINFGQDHAIVSVDGVDCVDVEQPVPELEIHCTLQSEEILNLEASNVTVTNGRYQGLRDVKPYLAFAMPPSSLPAPTISNVGARSVDLDWEDPSYWVAVTVTGYIVRIRAENETEFSRSVVYGNVTHATIIGLEPDTKYQFVVAALVEDQVFSQLWLHVDLYGRREALENAVIGENSAYSDVVRTLRYDFAFDIFNANATLNHSSVDERNTDGHIGIFGGEGHFGLSLIGDASVENCNASHSCCDSYEEFDNGTYTCHRSMSCSALGVVGGRDYSENITYDNDVSDPHRVESNVNHDEIEDDASIRIASSNNSHAQGRFAARCGPALRLTPSNPRSSGAAWYRRKIQVREGFDTTFTFRVSNPSLRCHVMDDVYTNCRSRGSDGFAMVVQNEHRLALGESGMGLGYDGIGNSIAVEFDMNFNYEILDPYENHVSIHTRGWRFPNSANHSYSLGHTVRVPNLADGNSVYDDDGPRDTDGIHVVRVVYNPVFDDQVLASGRFVSSPHVTEFMENADYSNGAMADWGTGMGTLSVYVDDLLTPVIVTPLNLAATLKLDNGRAWIGFTAATGDSTWQVHDILSWNFLSSRLDPQYVPPVVVNGHGAHECSKVNNGESCVHI